VKFWLTGSGAVETTVYGDGEEVWGEICYEPVCEGEMACFVRYDDRITNVDLRV